MDGWVRFHRKMVDSPVFHDPFLYKLWSLCLFKASYKPRDVLIGRQTVRLEIGEFVTGREALAREFNECMKASYQVNSLTLWRWLRVLENHGNLNIKANNKFSVITVVNYGFYNCSEDVDEHQIEQLVNNKGTSNEQLVNTNKKLINKERKEGKTKDTKIALAEFVHMTQVEHDKLIERLGEERARAYIERLDNYKGATGKRYQSDYRAILNWVDRDGEKSNGPDQRALPDQSRGSRVPTDMPPEVKRALEEEKRNAQRFHTG